MDTKERKAGIQTGPKRPARRPCRTRFWHPAHRSRGEKRLRKSETAFKRGAEKNFGGPPHPPGGDDLQDLSASRAVSGASSVAMIVTIDSAMM